MSHSHPQEPLIPERPLSVALNGWFWEQINTGSGQYLMQLLRALVELSSKDLYTVYVPAWCEVREGTDWMESRRVCIAPLRTPFDHLNRNLAKLWFEQIAVPRACRRAGVDLLHVPYWATPAIASVPVITTVHDLIPIILPAYRGSSLVRLYTRLVSRTLHRSTLVLTDSQASCEDIRRTFQLPAERARVIYLGIDQRYQPIEDEDRLRAIQKRYKLPRQFVLYLGGFDQRKNVVSLIRAYSRLLAVDETFPPLVIAGNLPKYDSSLFPDPTRETEKAGIAGRVHFAGWIAEEDKPDLYALAACFAFPSTYEGFGLPVLEAMACGTPVVTSKTSSLGELAGDGGILVDPHSEGEIAEAIETLVRDTSARAVYASKALIRAHQFRWSEAARLTRLAYRDVLAGNAGQHAS